MASHDELSNLETRATAILNDHNGVYLEKRLYSILKKEFPDLTRKTFQDVLNKLLEEDFVMQRGLIRPSPHNETSTAEKTRAGKKSGKGGTEKARSPDKRGI
ncbi:MAG TPA: hypothetical protein VK444_01135 [Methanobacteriaceae archaeon]|nr:hypothetical protein [Methanobacteriaceae archaeon]